MQKNDQLVIKADLPGMKKEDLSIEVTGDAITIQGERKSERDEQRDGVLEIALPVPGHRSARGVGSACAAGHARARSASRMASIQIPSFA